MPYQAFLSYSNKAESERTAALHSALQRFAKPWYRRRALRIFRDRANLGATSSLWPRLQEAIEQSTFFILIANPDSANSVWITREVEYWTALHGTSNLLIVWTGGELSWSQGESDFDWTRTTALPLCLKGNFSEPPLWLDLRWAERPEHFSLRNTRFRDCVATLCAELHGRPKDDLDGEDVRQHRTTVAVTCVAAALLLAATCGIFFFARQAAKQAMVANDQRRVAESRRVSSLARQLAADAELIRTQQPSRYPLSILLAIESFKRLQNLQAEQTLRNDLTLLPRRVFAAVSAAEVGPFPTGGES
jgi:hypothetical protein